MPDPAVRLVVLDVESTGPSPSQDHIVEFSARTGLGPDADVWTQRIRPGIPISPGATAVHGIRMEDVEHLDPFPAHADRIRSLIEGSDVVVGYNVGFDIEMIAAEFARHSLAPPNLSRPLIVDPFILWRACEPRDLQSAHRRFAGEAFEDAHSAEADIAATARVLEGMIDAFGLSDRSWSELAALGSAGPSSWIGSSSHVKWRDGEPTLAFGQHRGRTLSDIARERNGSYLKWVVGRDFPPHVVRIAELALAYQDDALRERLVSEFGSPPESPKRGDEGDGGDDDRPPGPPEQLNIL